MLGNRQLSLDLGKLFSTVGNTSINGRHIPEDMLSSPKVDKAREPRYQIGVLRTNCIDCLDRTNVAQYAYGLEALGRQLHAVGLTDNPKVDPDSGVAAALMEMYQNMGDSLALQYGGSEAHNYVCSPILSPKLLWGFQLLYTYLSGSATNITYPSRLQVWTRYMVLDGNAVVHLSLDIEYLMSSDADLL